MVFVKCVKDVVGENEELFFKEEKTYEVAEIDSDRVYAIDEFKNLHIVADSEGEFYAENIYDFFHYDIWFNEHFEYVGGLN